MILHMPQFLCICLRANPEAVKTVFNVHVWGRPLPQNTKELFLFSHAEAPKLQWIFFKNNFLLINNFPQRKAASYCHVLQYRLWNAHLFWLLWHLWTVSGAELQIPGLYTDGVAAVGCLWQSDRELYLLYASGMEILEACDSNWVNNLSNKLMHVLFYYGEPKSHLQDEHVL